MVQTYLILLICQINLVIQLSSCQEIIDKDHLKRYPYCGRELQSEATPVRARITNSKIDKTLHRWVVYVERTTTDKWGEYEETPCSGSVITSRHVLTSGHCICDHSEDPKKVKIPAKCLPGINRNQLSQLNRIIVHGGSRSADPDNPKWKPEDIFQIEEAVIMETLPKTNWFESIDIGIVITSKLKPFFNKKRLKVPSKLMQAKIIPICLPATHYDFSHKIIHGVGWGLRYNESPKPTGKTPSRNPLYSSCMTNHVGEEKWKFQSCDMKQIQDLDWSCEKQELPHDYEKNKNRCNEYFEDIERSEDKIVKDHLNDVDKIYVHDKEKNDNIVCYKKEHFQNMGWCHVHASDNAEAWGFCSPSCDKNIMKKEPDDSNPRFYHGLDWKVDKRTNNDCTRSSHFRPQHEVCMKSILPGATFMKFEFTGHPRKANLLKFDTERAPTDVKAPYIQVCNGDSGGGHWIKAYYPPKTKDNANVLVAVISQTYGTKSKDMHGNTLNSVCGGVGYDKATNAELVSGSTAIKIPYEPILKWIKTTAGIPNKS